MQSQAHAAEGFQAGQLGIFGQLSRLRIHGQPQCSIVDEVIPKGGG